MRRLALLALLLGGCATPRGQSAVPDSNPVLPFDAPSVTCDAEAEGRISGVVRNETTDAPLDNAIVVLQSNSLRGAHEMTTDEYGRYVFEGLPPGTYTIQVLFGRADVSKVVTLPDSAKFRANFNLDPERDFVCGLPVVRVMNDESLFSTTDELEAHLLGIPKTIRKL